MIAAGEDEREMAQLGHRVFAAACVALCGILPAAAQPAGDLFRGKEIALLIGGGVGGGADAYFRLLARHFGRFLPGNPSVVAKNVVGAGGLKLANQIYNVSPKDGTELGDFMTSIALEPLFGNKEAKYETAKFAWIGNMDTDATGCVASRGSLIGGWQDVVGRELNFGASGPGSTASIQAYVTSALLGARFKVIHGYQGTRISLVAMESGELDGICGLYLSTVRSQFAGAMASGAMRVWMTFGKERAADFADIATIYEVAKNDVDRALASLIFGQDALSRPLAGPPGMAPERVAALRSGFMATVADQAFLDDAHKMGLSIRPMSGEETQKQYDSFYATPKPVIARAMEMMGGR